MNLTLQIVICIALGLLGGGWLLYSRQAKELAEKTEELKRQKFENKQLIIIEEILTKLNHQGRPTVHAEAFPEGEIQKNGHSFANHQSGSATAHDIRHDQTDSAAKAGRVPPQNAPPHHTLSHPPQHNGSLLPQIPIEPVAITNPIKRSPPIEPENQSPPVVITTTSGNTADHQFSEHAGGNMLIQPPDHADEAHNITAEKETTVVKKSLLERLQSSSPQLTERLEGVEKKSPFNPFKSQSLKKQPLVTKELPQTQHPEKTRKPETSNPEQAGIKPVVATSITPEHNPPPRQKPVETRPIVTKTIVTKSVEKPAPPMKRRGESIPAPLNLDQDSNLYTRINDYARWVAGHSERFQLEHYENGQPAGQINLVFNHEELARLNGHWFNMFRPYDLDEILDLYNNPQNTLYCSYSAETIEQLRAPALQILAYVDSEDNKRYQTVIEECALKEFVHYLGELKQLAVT